MISSVIWQDIVVGKYLETLVRTRAPSEKVAKERAKRRALLHAGYSPTVLRRDGVWVKYEEVQEDPTIRVGNVWLVELKVMGLV